MVVSAKADHRKHRAEGSGNGDEAEASSQTAMAAGEGSWDWLPLLIPPLSRPSR